MKIGKFSTQSFKQIKMDGNVCWELFSKAGGKEVSDIKNMSLKGFQYGYVYYERDINSYILKGINPIDGKKQCNNFLGRYITAERVKNAINSYNSSK